MNQKVLFLGFVGAGISILVTIIPLAIGNLLKVHEIATFGFIGGMFLVIISVIDSGLRQVKTIYYKYCL
ncbi:hypothetical protein G7084_05195 [Weissella coleopterorum]|uniref:Uncharacterized protein n=1 Tax=Weissella coleopterorum TaxID=2714949 RepID=A0A6G8B0L0_9LACO|nr:hypothetical protein [Weissella coleopterorum]QIL50759.1 hypothetical protein G7084_05195 [Weissella coleopterorum]